jgi:hypothetical protein
VSGPVEQRKHEARLKADKFEEEALVAEALLRYLRAKVNDLRGQAGEADGHVYQARGVDDVAAAASADSQRQLLQRWADDAQRELDAWQRTQPF